MTTCTSRCLDNNAYVATVKLAILERAREAS